MKYAENFGSYITYQGFSYVFKLIQNARLMPLRRSIFIEILIDLGQFRKTRHGHGRVIILL